VYFDIDFEIGIQMALKKLVFRRQQWRGGVPERGEDKYIIKHVECLSHEKGKKNATTKNMHLKCGVEHHGKASVELHEIFEVHYSISINVELR